MMWKKDDAQGNETANPLQSEPKPVEKREPARVRAPGDRANIGRSITIKGDISGDEDLVIQGAVEGSVKLKENNVTISPEGRVKADIHGRTITVEGHVEGDLLGEEQVVLSPSCRVRGNITAPRVALEDGANFRGTIDMEAKTGKVPAVTHQMSAEKSPPRQQPAPEAVGAAVATKADGTKP